MSHVDSGFCVTDILAMYQTVVDQCPTLEIVRRCDYRTWATDNGGLLGDHPLPPVYQIKLLMQLAKDNVDVHSLARTQGVALPKDIRDLENHPWSLREEKALLKDEKVKSTYQRLTKETIGHDAEFVIRMKDQSTPAGKRAYEIGLVQNPVRKDEYIMVTDYFNDGNGILREPGVGTYNHKTDSWGADLKKSYAVSAAERRIKLEIKAGNPEFGSYKKVNLPDGRVKLEVAPRV